jgi:hypothetical protein
VALAGRLADRLDLRPEDLLIGLGDASSVHCRALVARVSLHYQIVVAAPRPRSSPPPPAAGIRFVDMSALEFARFPMHCDKILLDGDLLEPDEGEVLLPLLFDRLVAGGRLVAVLHAPGPSLAGARGRVAAVAARLHKSGFELLFDTVHRPPDRYDLVGGVKPALG